VVLYVPDAKGDGGEPVSDERECLHREVKMTSMARTRVVIVFALAVVSAFMLLSTNIIIAQEKQKISWSTKPENTQYAFQHGLEIPDTPGHILRMLEIRRTWPDGGAPTVEGQKVAEEIARGVTDLVAGNGFGRGYSVWRFENGDQSFGEWQNSVQTIMNPDRSRKTTLVGTYVTAGGTGKLKGVKGVGRYLGLTEFNVEGKATRNEYSAEGEYWFDKR